MFHFFFLKLIFVFSFLIQQSHLHFTFLYQHLYFYQSLLMLFLFFSFINRFIFFHFVSHFIFLLSIATIFTIPFLTNNLHAVFIKNYVSISHSSLYFSLFSFLPFLQITISRFFYKFPHSNSCLILFPLFSFNQFPLFYLLSPTHPLRLKKYFRRIFTLQAFMFYFLK